MYIHAYIYIHIVIASRLPLLAKVLPVFVQNLHCINRHLRLRRASSKPFGLIGVSGESWPGPFQSLALVDIRLRTACCVLG